MKFKIAGGRDKEFEAFVDERARAAKAVAGFKQIYLLRPTDNAEYRLVSWWEKSDNLPAWIRTESYEFSENPKHAGLVIGPIPYEVARVMRQW